MSPLEALGERVRVLRQAAGLTLQELAERASLSSRFVGDVERGRANPSLSSLQELASALGVPVVGLLLPLRGPAHEELLARLPGLSEADAEAALGALRARAGRPLALVGLRGAGKSAVGRLVAERTGRPFVEIDRVIERDAGMPLSSLFELHGESRYRELERRAIEAVLGGEGADRPAILEVSGGVVTDPATWRVLLKDARTVWLKATPQEHWDRVLAQGDRRPMGGRDRARAELEDLYTRRAPLYAEAAVTVATTGRTLDEVAEEVARLAAP